MDPTQLGMNRTDMQMSPIDAARLLEAAREFQPDIAGGASALAAFREPYLVEAEPVGSVPVPGTLGGAARSGVKALKGERLHAWVDKLGERLAFERGGTRLYDALISKCEVRADELGSVDMEMLRQFRSEEADHARLVAEVMEQLGADPTAQTPCADVIGASSLGLIQVVLDPRTSVAQSMQAVLTAELVDGEGWDLLIAMSREQGYDDIADRFELAAAAEAVHLENVRDWFETAVMESLHVGPSRH
jgi:rubrerythrin